MKIASNKNDNCVNRAISTMRLCLGYKESDQTYEFTETFLEDIVKYIGLCFQNHDVYIWCAEEKFMDAELNTHYCGSFYEHNYDDENTLIAFAYKAKKDFDDGHMVIGAPTFETLKVSLVVCVR